VAVRCGTLGDMTSQWSTELARRLVERPEAVDELTAWCGVTRKTVVASWARGAAPPDGEARERLAAWLGMPIDGTGPKLLRPSAISAYRDLSAKSVAILAALVDQLEVRDA